MQRLVLSFAAVATVLACASGTALAGPMQPRVFAPGEISSAAGVDCVTFMPDGKTVFFRQGPWSDGMIMVSHKVGGRWSRPAIAPFSGEWLDHDPAVAPDGSFIVYASNRPATNGGKALRGGQLWRVDREGGGWSDPIRLSDSVNFGTHVHAPSVAANGDLYFQSRDNPSSQFHLYRSAWRDGKYQKSVRLDLMPDGMHELDPAIAPDGSFIVFDAGRNDSSEADHLYLAFREHAGWGTPIDLGDAIDTYQPWGAHLGPDGTTLYFTGSYATRADWPRTRVQAERDLARTRAWDNGTSHVFSISLAPWLDAHRVNAAQHDASAIPAASDGASS